VDLVESAFTDSIDESFQVALFVPLNRAKHVRSAAVEVVFQV